MLLVAAFAGRYAAHDDARALFQVCGGKKLIIISACTALPLPIPALTNNAYRLQYLGCRFPRWQTP